VSEPPQPEAWRRHVLGLLTHGLSPVYGGENGVKAT